MPTEQRIPRKPVPNYGLQPSAPHTATHGTLSAPPIAPGRISERVSEEKTRNNAEERGTYSCVSTEGCTEEGDEDFAGLQTRIRGLFASEESFENLDGILTAQPDGMSTPMHRRSFNTDWDPGNNPSQDIALPHTRFSQVSANDADDELSDDDVQMHVSRRWKGKGAAKPGMQPQRDSTDPVLGMDLVEPRLTKKHPSPSRATLEELSRQFHALRERQELGLMEAALTPIWVAFEEPTARIPASRTAHLNTDEYHGFIRANPQQSTVTSSPAEYPVYAPPHAARAHLYERAMPTEEGRKVPRSRTSGGSSRWPSRYRTDDMDGWMG